MIIIYRKGKVCITCLRQVFYFNVKWRSETFDVINVVGAFTNWNGPERTGTDRDGQEWTSITGMDLKIHHKTPVLSVLDKKFWLSNVKYQISSVNRQLQYKNVF